jgi:4-hydroxybenzoate polyprenyltransferase
MSNVLHRWWIYQQERFPIGKYSILIAAYSLSAVGYSALLRQSVNTSPHTAVPPAIASFVIAYISIFLFFLQLRIADEFKDAADDAVHRPYRPVPRGLVNLKELGLIGLGCACIQLGLAIVIGWTVFWLLLGIWVYLSLMTQEFFIPHWLKAHPLAYLCSHMVIMPLMTLYASACDWGLVGRPPASLGWLLLTSFWGGVAIELGRKTRAPDSEEPGVETYSALWGIRMAAIAWLTALWLASFASVLAAHTIGAVVPVAAVIAISLFAAVAIVWRFLAHPTLRTAKWLEQGAGLWVLFVYPTLGILPLVLHWSDLSRPWL